METAKLKKEFFQRNTKYILKLALENEYLLLYKFAVHANLTI